MSFLQPWGQAFLAHFVEQVTLLFNWMNEKNWKLKISPFFFQPKQNNAYNKRHLVHRNIGLSNSSSPQLSHNISSSSFIVCESKKKSFIYVYIYKSGALDWLIDASCYGIRRWTLHSIA